MVRSFSDNRGMYSHGTYFVEGRNVSTNNARKLVPFWQTDECVLSRLEKGVHADNKYGFK